MLLKGVNRHTFWPDAGRASSPKIGCDVQVFTPNHPDLELAGRTFVPFPRKGGAGSKIIAAEDSGTQGRKTVATGDYKGSVSFFFGR